MSNIQTGLSNEARNILGICGQFRFREKCPLAKVVRTLRYDREAHFWRCTEERTDTGQVHVIEVLESVDADCATHSVRVLTRDHVLFGNPPPGHQIGGGSGTVLLANIISDENWRSEEWVRGDPPDTKKWTR